MAQTHHSSHKLEDAALILLGLSQAAVLASWGITSATSAVKSIGFGVPEETEHSRFSKGVKIAGMLGFAVLIAAALARRGAVRAAARRDATSHAQPMGKSAEALH